MQQLCVGLFGTCGGSTWRNKFIERYNNEDIMFFNPQVEEWDPSMAAIEDLKEAAAVYNQIVCHFDSVSRKVIPELSDVAKELISGQKNPGISLISETVLDSPAPS